MNKEIMRIKESHWTRDNDGLSYDNLCGHPGVNLPVGYKIPKFETISGTEKPMAHFRRYYDQMVKIGSNRYC